ncbi:MAG: hypothetical protein NVS2B17_11250 [Candidatus Velthaea sp.]
MKRSIRLAVLLAIAAAVTARAAAACETGIPAAMFDRLDSATARPGQVFRFKTTRTAAPNGILIPPGTIGVGVVRAVTRAGRRNRYGSLAIEPRYLVLPHARQQQVSMDPTLPAAWSSNEPNLEKAAGHVPIPLPGLAMSAVNIVRFGRDVTLGPGFVFDVVPVFDLLRHPAC